MVVEDLHWIDRTSEEYVASLVESFGRASILCIATYRPGYRPGWMDKSYATQIALRPLSAEESLAVVRSSLRARELSPELTERIVAKAQGNPFFLEELARSVGEQADPADGRRRSRTPSRRSCSARIDRLPDRCGGCCRRPPCSGRTCRSGSWRRSGTDPVTSPPGSGS